MATVYYTVGPASEHIPEEMMQAGARGARLTFSYRTTDVQLERARDLRKASKEIGIPFEIIADVEGAKSRLGEIRTSGGLQSFILNAGSNIELVHATALEVNEVDVQIPIADGELFRSLRLGDVVVVGDGNGFIRITEVTDHRVLGEIEFDCTIEGNRGISIQGANSNPATLTKKGERDLAFIAQHPEFDAVAISFVSNHKDIESVAGILRSNGSPKPIYAKIETPQGVQNIEKIKDAASKIIIGRGDLALTSPWFEMPRLAQFVVDSCRKSAVPWIMATQIAEGLELFPQLTRAESCDLWHWANLGCEGVLLSHETAHTSRPVDAVQIVSQLLQEATTTRLGQSLP